MILRGVGGGGIAICCERGSRMVKAQRERIPQFQFASLQYKKT